MAERQLPCFTPTDDQFAFFACKISEDDKLVSGNTSYWPSRCTFYSSSSRQNQITTKQGTLLRSKSTRSWPRRWLVAAMANLFQNRRFQRRCERTKSRCNSLKVEGNLKSILWHSFQNTSCTRMLILVLPSCLLTPILYVAEYLPLASWNRPVRRGYFRSEKFCWKERKQQ